MNDEEVRSLERDASMGNPEALEKLLAHRARQGMPRRVRQVNGGGFKGTVVGQFQLCGVDWLTVVWDAEDRAHQRPQSIPAAECKWVLEVEHVVTVRLTTDHPRAEVIERIQGILREFFIKAEVS